MPRKIGETFKKMVEKMRNGGGSTTQFQPPGSKQRYDDHTPKGTHRPHAPRTSGFNRR